MTPKTILSIILAYKVIILLQSSMQELLENLDLVKARAASGTDESKTELAIAHKTIGVLQMAFW
jgi:hypothetical protein